jgi:sulfonate transport system ATP-binding protein
VATILLTGCVTAKMGKVEINIKSKSFQEDRVLENVNLLVREGDVVVVLGPSGSGKTTLLRIISGLDREFEGQVLVDGQPVYEPTGNVGVVFQDVRLFPWMTVEQNIKFARSNSDISTQKIEWLLDFVDLDGSVKKLYPRQLSGGMSKRVGLARALANDPSLLLLDESFSELDAKSKYELYETLLKHKRENKQSLTIILVTHDIDEAAFLGDRIVVFSDGRPSTMLREFQVALPHPRNRKHPEYIELCAKLMMQLISNIDQEVKAQN